MVTRTIKVGKGRHRTDQIVTNSWGPNPGRAIEEPHEHVTMETPHPLDTIELRLLTESVKVWP